MSRSFKKTPMIKDRVTGMKNAANRKVRRRLNNQSFELANGRAYRKVFESWDISDYAFFKTYRECLADAERYKKACLHGAGGVYGGVAEEMSYRQWYRTYKGK